MYIYRRAGWVCGLASRGVSRARGAAGTSIYMRYMYVCMFIYLYKIGGRARHLSESDDEVIDGGQWLPPRRGGCRTRAYAGCAGAAVAESRGKIQRVDVDAHARCRQGEGVGGVCACDACGAGTGI